MQVRCFLPESGRLKWELHDAGTNKLVQIDPSILNNATFSYYSVSQTLAKSLICTICLMQQLYNNVTFPPCSFFCIAGGGGVNVVVPTNDGTRFLTGAVDSQIRVWRIRDKVLFVFICPFLLFFIAISCTKVRELLRLAIGSFDVWRIHENAPVILR